MTDRPPGLGDPGDESFIGDAEVWLRELEATGFQPDSFDDHGIPAVLRRDILDGDPDGHDLDDNDDGETEFDEEVDVDGEGQDPADRPEADRSGGGPPNAGGNGPADGQADGDGWSADGVEPQLHRFVKWLIPALELWERIPPCWVSHAGIVEELRVAHELYEAALNAPATEAPRCRADWHDYLGRVLDRVSRSPGGVCAQRGEHRGGRTWDRQRSAEQRRAGRQPTPNPPPPGRPEGG